MELREKPLFLSVSKELFNLNQFLTSLLNTIAIDLEHLQSNYLSTSELTYLDREFTSVKDLERDYYTDKHGDNLECLLTFLRCHKSTIIDLFQRRTENEKLIELYTSDSISGSYDCFRFDLSKFPQTYVPKNEVITLFRIGREEEKEDSLGCSWARSIDGLIAFCDASCLSKAELESRPIFVLKIEDNQVLFEGKCVEGELVLKADFSYLNLSHADASLRMRIGRA